MNEESKTICVYTMPQEMPCGPASSCCGPIGQTEEEIDQLRRELEHALPGVQVETINIRHNKLNVQRDAAALKVIQTFGSRALPVLVVDAQVISIGPPQVPELVAKLQAKITSSAAAEAGGRESSA